MKTVKEFAKIFNVSDLTVRRWIDSGLIEVVRVGRTIRIPESEIKRLQKER